MQATGLYLMGLACLVLGLGVAWLQAENHARGHALQVLERENFDLEVTNRELDARLTAELQRLESELVAPESLETHAAALGGEGLQ